MNGKNLISNFKNENELDIEKIINEYSNYLYTVIHNSYSNFLTDEDIEEIILDVFVAIWNNREKLDENRNIKPYLASITHNLCKKRYGNNKGNIEVTNYEENDLIQCYNTDNGLKINEINSILKELSEEDYKIFTEFYYFSRKTKEIAKELGISNANVKTKLHRIRRQIKKKLKERGYSI